MNNDLAIHGGKKAVTISPTERWQPPYEEIKAAINERIDRNAFSGDWNNTYFKFEDKFGDYMGAKYCSAYNEGSTALWAAYLGIGVKPGDEIIVPSYTWIASIASAVYIGAKPVFCELERGKLVADPVDIRKRITSKTKAIVVVHLFGNLVNMDEIMAIANEHNLYVIEDCSHCHGAEWKGKKAGTIGHVGCFSMQGDFITGKAVPAGEGGMLISNDREIFNKIIFYTHINRPEKPGEETDEKYSKYYPANMGVKFRAHPFALAIAGVAMKSLDSNNDAKRSYRQKINNGLKDIPGIITLTEYEGSVAGGFYGGMQVIYDPAAFSELPKDKFEKALQAEGVDTSYRDYEPLHTTPLYAEGYDMYGNGMFGIAGDYQGYKTGDLPVTEETCRNIIGMPIFIDEVPGYSDQVIAAFKKVAEHYRDLL